MSFRNPRHAQIRVEIHATPENKFRVDCSWRDAVDEKNTLQEAQDAAKAALHCWAVAMGDRLDNAPRRYSGHASRVYFDGAADLYHSIERG